VTLHTDLPTRDQIGQLLLARSFPAISIYLPTHRVPQQAQADRLVLRDLVRRATERLHEATFDPRAIADIEDQLMDLVDDDRFWQEQADSLAVFATPERVATFRLPNELTAAVAVSDRFHIKPLLRSVTFPQAAWVLALSKQDARLLEVGPSGPPRVVEVDGMPDRDGWDAKGDELREPRSLSYAREIDRALRSVLTGSSLPLVLAAAQPMAGTFRSVCTYPNLVEEREHGNPDRTPDSELADAVRSILDDLYAAELVELAQEFDRRRSEGRAAFDVSDIARLATFGAVDTVLVDIDRSVPGRIDDDSGAVTFEDGEDADTYGVVDEIARRVLLQGGRVMAVRADEVPGGGAAAALLRYAV